MNNEIDIKDKIIQKLKRDVLSTNV